MDDLLILALVLLFLLLEGLFSGGEIALVSSDINKIRGHARRGSRSARIALDLMERPEWFLSTTLTGTNLCVVSNTALATVFFISLFGPAEGERITAAVMIPLLLVFGEIVPKSIFQQHAESIALRVSWFIWIASWILYPLVLMISKISRMAVHLLSRGIGIFQYPCITRGGLKYLLTNTAESDILKTEQEMIGRIFDITEATAGRIMTPLSAMTALPVDATLHEAAGLFAERGYSRIPLYRERIFNIVGILRSFDILEALYGTPPDGNAPAPRDTVEGSMKETPLYIPESKSAMALLFELQKQGNHMAVVVDEYGGALGIVTIEDILEEIVGEIENEYTEEGQILYSRVGPGKYLFNGQAKMEILRKLIAVDFPDGEYETLAGFLLNSMGKIPKRNEIFRMDPILFVIEDGDMKSIRNVLVILPPGMELMKG